MKQRGRQSAAALTLVGTVVERLERPAPPVGMPEEQAAIWRTTVNSLAADWFRPEQLPLLAQYCRHVVASNVIALQIEAVLAEEPLEGEKARYFLTCTYKALLEAQRGETVAIVSLATKMRIAQQSTYDKSARKPETGDRPWR